MEYSSDTFLRMAEYIRQGAANREIYLAHIYEILYHLFSGKETLAEKYGIKEMASELKKRSKMYDDELLRIYDDN